MKVTIRQTITRLRHLERVMREVAKKPRNAFDMEEWAVGWEKGEEGAPPCGTSACCAGWAGLDPAIRRMGLTTTMHTTPGGGVRGRVECRTYDRDEWTFRPSGDDAACIFFGVTRDEADLLFMSGWRMSAGQKAAQVARLRAKYERRLAKAVK